MKYEQYMKNGMTTWTNNTANGTWGSSPSPLWEQEILKYKDIINGLLASNNALRNQIEQMSEDQEALITSLRYLHDNIVEYYPSTYDFPSMVSAREVLSGINKE